MYVSILRVDDESTHISLKHQPHVMATCRSHISSVYLLPRCLNRVFVRDIVYMMVWIHQADLIHVKWTFPRLVGVLGKIWIWG